VATDPEGGYTPVSEDPRAAIAEVFGRVAEVYDQQGVDFFSQFGRRLVALAGLKPGWRVLDVGTGRGAVLFPAADAVIPGGGEVLGVDLAQAMVDATAAEVQRRGLQHVYLQALDAQTLPGLPERAYDAVLSGLSAFFMPDPHAGLRRWFELLRPGGRLAISTFSGEDFRFKPAHEALAAFMPEGPRFTAPGLEPFKDNDAVTDLLRSAGFVEVGNVERVHDTVFRSPEHWWEWQNSHGGKATLDLIAPERLDEARAAAVEALRPLCEPDGTLVLHPKLRYTVADKPH
jgi:ubiquinone/menaquinone biosynthesis C-methylase UbiE